MSSSFSSSTSIDRKSLKKVDGFLSTTRNFFDGLAQHSKAALIALLLVISGSIVAAFLINHYETRAEAARNALYVAEKAFESELKALAQFEKPKNEAIAKIKDQNKKKVSAKENTTDESLDDQQLEQSEKLMQTLLYKNLNVDSKFPDSIKKFKEVEQTYSGTRFGYEARLKLGNLYFDHGNFAQALPWYEKAFKTAPANFEKVVSLSAMGYTYEGMGKYSEAIEYFQKALNLGEGSFKGDLLLGLARSYEGNHDSVKARSTYEQILAEFPGTDLAKKAEIFKAQF